MGLVRTPALLAFAVIAAFGAAIGHAATVAAASDACCAHESREASHEATSAQTAHDEGAPCQCPEGCDEPCACCATVVRSAATTHPAMHIEPARFVRRLESYPAQRDTAFDAGLVRDLSHVPRSRAHV